jgi:hypothetical protein
MEGFSKLPQATTSFLLKLSYKCALLSLRNAPLLSSPKLTSEE